MPNPTCLDNCTAELPVMNFSKCLPTVLLSEIGRIFQAKATAAPFANWLSPTEWLTRMSNTSVTGDDYIRAWTVIADKPAATAITKEISNGRKQLVGKDFVINFTIDDVTQSNYEWMRNMECGGTYRFWFETAGGKIYGGNNGVLMSFSTLDDLLNRGVEEVETITGQLSWRSRFSPERGQSPIFDGDAESVTPTTFDSEISMASSATPAAVGGISAVATSTDADQIFEFNAISGASDLPIDMNITVGSTLELVVTAPGEYAGQAFRYTDKAGVEHTGTFIDGDVTF